MWGLKKPLWIWKSPLWMTAQLIGSLDGMFRHGLEAELNRGQSGRLGCMGSGIMMLAKKKSYKSTD